ncbi:MAG: nuclear transport factor 2 family protein [Bacteroidales bacterium]|nr:nuclear transport factor 2 family protein [Bacteroidales bacterium]
MKKSVYIILTGLIIVFLSQCKTNNDPESLLMSYLEAHNEHDIDETMDYFTVSARFIIESQTPLLGKDAIRKLEEWNKAIDSRLEMFDMTTKGDTVFIGKIIERNKWFEIIGIDQVEYAPGTFVVYRDGLISEFHPSGLSEESTKQLAPKFKSFMEWATKEKAKELREMMPDKKFDYKPEKAEIWFQLLKEWKELPPPAPPQ